jgi:hypothetical protein
MRYSRLVRSALCGAAMAGFVVAAAPMAMSAVYSPQQALPAATVQNFLANPESLLTQYPNGGPQMITAVRDLVASDPATVAPLIALLKSANDAQATAAGTAFGQVALMAVNKDQPFAVDLQTQIAASGNVPALVAFSAVVGGDIKLAAATGGAGIGGGGESQTSTSSGLGGFFAGTPLNLGTGVRNTPDQFNIPSFGGSSPGSSISQFR